MKGQNSLSSQFRSIWCDFFTNFGIDPWDRTTGNGDKFYLTKGSLPTVFQDQIRIILRNLKLVNSLVIKSNIHNSIFIFSMNPRDVWCHYCMYGSWYCHDKILKNSSFRILKKYLTSVLSVHTHGIKAAILLHVEVVTFFWLSSNYQSLI